MNISSVVIYTLSGADVDTLRADIEALSGCEFVTHEDGKIVATITSENFDDEIKAFCAMECMNGVDKVMMIYTYNDLDAEIATANTNNIEAIMQEIDTKKPEEIKYSGKVNL